jgi:YjbE family integral membrane protein
MEFIASSAFWIGLLKIIWVNILLSGDNAVVIALASRGLPEKQQKKAILWGSVAAIIMRVILTFFAVQLLQLPWLKAVGAVLLVWIGVQLFESEDETEGVKEVGSLYSAIKTILVADLVMSLDNVLAVAAAAEAAPGDAKQMLIVFGLALSIPIVVFGSNIVLKLMERFPIIISFGAMLLGWIAGEMLAKEEVILPYLQKLSVPNMFIASAGALLVFTVGKVRAGNNESKRQA